MKEEDVERAVVEFDNNAAKIYSEVFAKFNSSIGKIRRDNEENVFKMQLSKYTYTLRNELDKEVRNLLNSSHPKIHKNLETVLSSKIEYYLQEFRRKCNAL
jgi:hypothetical protein